MNMLRYANGGVVLRDEFLYIPRAEDDMVYELLSNERNVVTLTAPRQSGKTSLAKGIEERLLEIGHKVAYVDLRIYPGTSGEANQWFKSLLYGIIDGFAQNEGPDRPIKLYADSFFKSNDPVLNFKGLGYAGTVVEFFKKRLKGLIGKQPATIILDEIEFVSNSGTPHTDQLFHVIRYLFELRKELDISFLLVGLFHPTDLIKRDAPSSFNVGTDIKLRDFILDSRNIESWATGLKTDENNRNTVAHAILRQTGGQPYLTCKLCNLFNKNSNSTQDL